MENTNNTLKDFQLSGDSTSKSSEDYGKNIIAEVDRYINTTYYKERNNRFLLNEKMASGKMDMNAFKVLFDMADTQKNYARIIWKSIMIVNTIISRMVGRWMQTKEKAIVKGVDEVSINKKKEAADQAEFYMEFKDQLAQVQEASGVPLVPKSQFIPDDKDHLDIWTKYELYLPEEYLYRKGINTVLDNAGWGMSGVNRRRIKHNSATFGLVAACTWADKNGKIHPDWINPKNAIYSYSEYDDFRDCDWMGHICSKKLSEIRDEFPKLDEKTLFKIAQQSKDWQTNDKLTWTDNWSYSYVRPYDDWNVDLVYFELKSLDSETYSMKVTSNGNLLIEKGAGNTNLNGDVSRETKTKWNIYQGIYLKKDKTLLKWGIKDNPVRPQDSQYAGGAEFSYSFHMYQNVQMRNLAIPEKIEEPVEQMILARLKIQQLVAQMRAAGLLVDVDGMQSIDLGTGDGALTPMQLERVYNQKGNVYYRGKDAEGNRVPNPITELPNAGSVPQLQQLILIYNFHLQVVRDEIGENEIAEGQTPKPRVTNDAVQGAMDMSFNAVDYMNDSCLSLMKDISRKIACLLHDSVEFGSKEYSSIVGQEYVKDRVYDVQIEEAPTEEEINLLMSEVMGFIQQNPDFVLYVDPMKIRKIAEDSIDLASVYFRRAQKKAINGAEEKANRQSDYNANAQAKSGLQVAAANKEVEIMKGENELALAKEKQREIVIQGLFGIYQKGLSVPDSIKAVEGEIVHNILLPIFSENAAMKQQASQIQHPESQMQNPQEENQEQMQPMQGQSMQ